MYDFSMPGDSYWEPPEDNEWMNERIVGGIKKRAERDACGHGEYSNPYKRQDYRRVYENEYNRVTAVIDNAIADLNEG